jgi:hypothetical protein
MGIQSLRLLQFITAIIDSNKIKRWDLCYREKKLETNNLEDNEAKKSQIYKDEKMIHKKKKNWLTHLLK